MEIERAYGPFCGDPEGALAVRRVSYPPDPGFVVRSDTQAELIDLAARLKFFTKHQAVRLLGAAAERQLKALHKAGYLDLLLTGRTPPIYTQGPGLAELLGTQRPQVRMPGLLRVVAANQLYICLGGIVRYEAAGEEWPTAVLIAGSNIYWVLAPRLWPGEDLWLDSAVDCMDADARLIIVAPSEQHALDMAASLVTKGILVRYTWDTELKDAFCLFRYTARGFVVDEKAVDFFRGHGDNESEGASPSFVVSTTRPEHDRGRSNLNTETEKPK